MLNLSLLDAKLAELQSVRAWSAAQLPALRTLLTTAADEALLYLNPLAFAATHQLPKSETIEAWLHATKIGLLEMNWQLLCAWCGSITESFRGLASLHSHYVCRVCGTTNNHQLDDTILASFGPHPQVRASVFQQPTQLTPAQLYEHYYLSPDLLPFSTGQSLREVLVGLTRFYAALAPGETFTAQVPIQPGMLYLAEVVHPTLMLLRVKPIPRETPQPLQLQLINGKFQAQVPHAAPIRLTGSPPHPDTLADQYLELEHGPLTLEITNHSQRPAQLRLLQIDRTYPRETLRFRPFLTGKQLLTTQVFRELFYTEAVASDESLAVQEVSFLFTDLKDSTALYEQVGDPQAYLLVRQHFQVLTQIVADHAGTIVKTMGDAIMAVFFTPLASVQAALAMHQAIAHFNQNTAAQLELKIGLHCGPSILVTQNGRLDYFGQTVNIAARVQSLAETNEILLSEALYQLPEVTAALSHFPLTARETLLRGLNTTLTVYRVGTPLPPST